MWPKWFRLVNYYNEEVSYAPTIPFVLGAIRTPIGKPAEDENDCIDELRKLIQSVIEDTPEGYVIQLHRCGQIGEPVLVPCLDRLMCIPGNPLSSKRQERVTVLADDEFVSSGLDELEAIVEILWEELGDAILDRRFSFSRRTGEYRKYNDRDFEIIRDTFGQT